MITRPPIPRFIAICGAPRLRRAVADVLGPFGYRACAFADPARRAAMEIYGLTYAQVYGTPAEQETVDPRWQLAPDMIVSELVHGAASRRVLTDTWVRALFDEIQRLEAHGEIPFYNDGTAQVRGWRWTTAAAGDRPRLGWVITDLSHANEHAAITQRGGELWRVRIPLHCALDEVGPNALSATREIVTNGTVDDLRPKVIRVLMEAAGNVFRVHTIDPTTGQDVPAGASGSRTMQLVYGYDGGLVGDPDFALQCVVEAGVLQPEKPTPGHKAAAVGKSLWGQFSGRWVGWSHRTVAAFGIGDMRFDASLLDRTKPDYVKWGQTPFQRVGLEPVTTDAEAREAAVAFAEHWG